MENLHPEYTAISGILLNIIIEVCKAHGIVVTASMQGDLTILLMWTVSRVVKKLDPPKTADLQKQIVKNVQNEEMNK